MYRRHGCIKETDRGRDRFWEREIGGGVEKERQIGGGQEVYSERQRGRKIFRERGRELKTAAKTIQEMFDGPRESKRRGIISHVWAFSRNGGCHLGLKIKPFLQKIIFLVFHLQPHTVAILTNAVRCKSHCKGLFCCVIHLLTSW